MGAGSAGVINDVEKNLDNLCVLLKLRMGGWRDSCGGRVWRVRVGS